MFPHVGKVSQLTENSEKIRFYVLNDLIFMQIQTKVFTKARDVRLTFSYRVHFSQRFLFTTDLYIHSGTQGVLYLVFV